MVKVGIIGTNWGGKVQTPIFRAAGLEVVAIYSRKKEKAQKLEFKIVDQNSQYVSLINNSLLISKRFFIFFCKFLLFAIEKSKQSE